MNTRALTLMALVLVEVTPRVALSGQPALDAVIGPVALGDTRDAVLSKLGKPIRVVQIGDFLGSKWHYDGLDVYYYIRPPIVVGQIEATNPHFCTENGVCPGEAVESANAKLGSPHGGGKLIAGENTFLVRSEACWLPVVVAQSKIKSLAIKCQP